VPKQDAKPKAAPLPQSAADWEALKRQATEARRAKRVPMRAARGAEPPLSPSEREELEKAKAQIKSLKTRVQNLRAELHHVRGHSDSEIAKGGGMNFQTMSAIAKTLHPDSTPSEAERAEACKLWGHGRPTAAAPNGGEARPPMCLPSRVASPHRSQIDRACPRSKPRCRFPCASQSTFLGSRPGRFLS
jgi:hypothetical protein